MVSSSCSINENPLEMSGGVALNVSAEPLGTPRAPCSDGALPFRLPGSGLPESLPPAPGWVTIISVRSAAGARLVENRAGWECSCQVGFLQNVQECLAQLSWIASSQALKADPLGHEAGSRRQGELLSQSGDTGTGWPFLASPAATGLLLEGGPAGSGSVPGASERPPQGLRGPRSFYDNLDDYQETLPVCERPRFRKEQHVARLCVQKPHLDGVTCLLSTIPQLYNVVGFF